MNYGTMIRSLSLTLLLEIGFMAPSLCIALYTHDMPAMKGFLVAMVVAAGIAGIFSIPGKEAKRGFYEREGMLTVGLVWIFLGLVGAIPFYASGRIPSYVDSLFEIVSGFTTTGASVVSDVEALGKALLFWRSFSHWIGGMGVLVFFLAIMTRKNAGYTLHILRAESPGPSVGKMRPRVRDTAVSLYRMYIVLTVADFFCLLIGKMKVFDAICIAFGTAGTGGFAVLNSGCATYTPFAQVVTTVFMLLFGVNFGVYYMLLHRQTKEARRNEELRFYIVIVVICISLITFNTLGKSADTATFGDSLRHSAFQVASIITTTGFSTTDFNLWPGFSQAILICLMLCGACAGSTGGGMKVSRVIILIKAVQYNVRNVLHPGEVHAFRYNCNRLDEKTVRHVQAYLSIYVFILIVGFLLLSIDPINYSMTTDFTSVVATFNNIGPGLESVGPMANYGGYNAFSKLVMVALMLLGRLEIYPIIALTTVGSYKRA